MNTKNDQVDTTHDASPHHSDRAKIQETVEREKAKEKDECNKNPEGETEEGNSSNTDCDQGSEVSFMGDTDEDIDTTEIEEDWIEYMRRSTRLAEEKMRTANILAGL